MKYVTRLLPVLLFCLGGSVFAQDAATPTTDEIATAYVDAIGGADAWMSLKTIAMKGSASMQGMELPITVTTAEGNKFKMEMDIQGSPMVQAYDGSEAWMLFPMQGITEPKIMTDEESAELKQTPFIVEFVNYADRGYTLTSVPGKEVEGTMTYGIQVTNEEGYDRTYYFDTESMVPLMQESVAKSGPMAGVVSETYLSDYQEVEGLMMPMFMEQKMNGQTAMKMTITEVSLNNELADDFFSAKQ